jgi:hypothetical protein
MSFSRMLAVALFSLTAASAVHAADTSAFSVLVNDSAGHPIMFQSTTTLKRGDVINVRSFNAEPVMILQVAMCNSDCPHMHLVKTVSLTPYFIGITNTNEDFVVPEDGHVAFWVQQVGGVASLPLSVAGGNWSLQYVDPFLSFATPRLYPETRPMPPSGLLLDDNTMRMRFYHRTFVTVALTDANG